ncbi:hypothetical protein [Peribacillus tepidiphilus]|uniref:hypothetical protein n=1 Tax=Peribacillus tepidiphilus TaxID=2652445 RepID=UPI001291E1F4|nr:hypothetical protein [Peribacillus tepidiphilus]
MLYDAAFHTNHRLTHEKLNLFIFFLNSGFRLSENPIVAAPQLPRVLNKEAALIKYWMNLDQIKSYQTFEKIDEDNENPYH